MRVVFRFPDNTRVEKECECVPQKSDTVYIFGGPRPYSEYVVHKITWRLDALTPHVIIELE